MRILIILGHPRKRSLCGALACAFGEGAGAAGCEVETLCLGDLSFNPDVVEGSPAAQALEPDLERARSLIAWAGHLVLVFPNWWGTMPARLKGFLDRVLVPGFAFREQDGHYYGLLGPRTAELVTTMDVPPLVYRWIQAAPGRRAISRATLGLCGVATVRATAFARVSHSDEAMRCGWIAEADDGEIVEDFSSLHHAAIRVAWRWVVTMRRIGKLAGALRRALGRYRCVVLLYHRVAEPGSDPWTLCVTPRHFAEQMAFLQRSQTVVRLADMVTAQAEGCLSSPTVAVTFDDGYADNLDAAKPILEQHGIPATCFVTTGRGGREHEYWWDELERVFLQPGTLPDMLELAVGGRILRRKLGRDARYDEALARCHRDWRTWHRPVGVRQALYRELWLALQPLPDAEQQAILVQLAAWAGLTRAPRPGHRALSDAELASLVKGGLVEIGAHTDTHPVLPALPVAAQRRELRHSRERCQAIAGPGPVGLAYPYGRYAAQTVALAREAGFAFACTTAPFNVRAGGDPFRLPRVEVRDWDGQEFARQLFR